MYTWPETSSLDALLSDSLVQLAMRADGVEPDALKVMLTDVGRKLGRRPEVRLVGGSATFDLKANAGAGQRSATVELCGLPAEAPAGCGLAQCW